MKNAAQLAAFFVIVIFSRNFGNCFTNLHYQILLKMKKTLLLFVLSLITPIAFGQQKEYNFINFSTKDGLASNSVNAICKDKYGYMWFGTEDGLNKFDGQKFTAYHHRDNDKTSIGRGAVMAILEDKNGNLWIGTNITLSVYNRELDNFTNYDLTKLGWVRSLCADHLGNIWVGTYTGLLHFDTQTKNTKLYKASPNDKTKLISDVILSVFEDSKKNIWIGTRDGLNLYNPQNQSFKRFVHDDNNPNSLSDNTIRTISEDKYGNLWLGTDNGGLNVMNLDNQTFKSFRSEASDPKTISSNRIHKITFDNLGKLWVGTDAGLCIFDVVSGQAQRISASLFSKYNQLGDFIGHSVKDIYIDNSGIYWVGTGQGGVNKYDKNLSFFSNISYNPFNKQGLSVASVTSLAEGLSGNIFIGTDGGGLQLFNRQTKTIKNIPISGQNNTVLGLEKTQNTLWVGTYSNGLCAINLKTNSSKQELLIKKNGSNSLIPINCLKTDSKGFLWIGTNGNGLYRYNPVSKELLTIDKIINPAFKKKYTLNGYIVALAEDKNGRIWIGSNGNGIAVYSPQDGSVSILNHQQNHLPIDKVLDIFVDNIGRIWVGVLGGGLSLYNPKTNAFTQFNERQLSSNSVIYKILEDELGKLWLSTNKGISVFDPIKQKFKNYTHQNGIQQGAFNVGAGIKTSSGEMFFGGLDGINYFYPEKLYQNTNTPALLITDLKINNKSANPIDNSEITEPISLAKEINLSYKQNFSLDFIALNYTAPHENQYTYKLEGFDKEWNYVGPITTAVYTNLDPGDYVFRLKAQSEDGSWQAPEKTIKIVVNPPFWRTYFAYFLYFSVFAITLYTIRSRGIRKLKDEFALEQERLEVKYLIERERREAEKKMELEQLKIKFLTNLSHELKTPLTLILNPIENLLNQEQKSEKLEILNIVNRNAKRLLNLVNQLLDLRKIEDNELKLNLSKGDLVFFTREIFDSFKYISERKNIHLDFESSVKKYFTNFDRDKVERILINLLSNAIKFTNEHGNVYCQIEKVGGNGIKIIIGDSGIGISDEMKNRIFERFFQINNGSNILNQGSGIGLSIAQEFVKLHGGTISLESEENMGSIFTVFLPLEEIESTTEINPEILADAIITETNFQHNSSENRDNSSIRAKKPVILIVDDNEDLRTYLRESLKADYKIIEAADGKQGWQKTLAAHPELIVSDVNMPNVDGLDFVKKVRNDNRTKHIPIIMLTVLGEEFEQIKGLETGANDYLTKPFSFKVLNVKIKNLLSLNDTFKNTYTKQIKLETPEIKVESEDEKFLLKIGNYIEQHLTDSEFSIEDLSQKMFMSRGTLYNKILVLTGETPVEYIRSIKLKKALVLLEKSDLKISQIGYEVGFSNPNYFTRAFKAKFGISPTEYIEKNKTK